MKLRDWTFQRLFSQLFVYNILYEDSEVDERYLGIDEGSTVLGISGAGCRIAGHLSARPRRIDAVDINKHHLALTALKVAAAQRLRSYSSFYDLFGRGWHAEPESVISRLIEPLPSWMGAYWRDRYDLFSESMFRHSLASRLFGTMRNLSGIDGAWLRSMITASVEERWRAIDERLVPVLRTPWVTAVLESPLYLISLGINYAQSERILRTENKSDLIDFLIMHMKRVADTDLERNWIAWHCLAGYYNHDHPEAVPPYLRKDRHERSVGAPTITAFHHKNVFDVLSEAGPNTWSHFTFCDAPDWMPAPTQRRLFDEVLRTSRDGGVLSFRSVETESLITRHGLEKHFQLLEDESMRAAIADRTRQYRRVDYYRIVH